MSMTRKERIAAPSAAIGLSSTRTRRHRAPLAAAPRGVEFEGLQPLWYGGYGGVRCKVGVKWGAPEHDPIYGKLCEWELEVQRRRGKEFTRSKSR